MKTVQEKLDAGETPLEVYTADNTTLNSLYGATYAGGLIFYFDETDGTGMVAAPTLQSSSSTWGCNNTNIGFTEYFGGGHSFFVWEAIGTAIGTGNENTNNIVNKCSTSSAAKVCFDLNLGGYIDWYLPSRDEAIEMITKVSSITDSYWTSSQRQQQTGAYAVYSDLTYLTIPKANHKKVRAIRNF